MIISSHRRALVLAPAAIAASGGAAVALHYHRLGLTLTHYDARAHLVVARRIFDSVTPGWQQIGAVWLPLPHLLNAIPIQVEFFYRTGASAVAFSIAAFAVATAAIVWIVASLTRSLAAGIAGAAVFALNPNVLYLQSTPMAEMELIALTLVAVALLIEWCRTMADLKVGTTPAADAGHVRKSIVGVAFALACLTRYEAWPVTVAACVAAAWTLWRAGSTLRASIRAVAAIGIYPAGAILAFSIFSWIVSGTWFPNDFYVAENVARSHPYESIKQIVWGVRALSGSALLIAAAAGLACACVVALNRRRAVFLIPVALVAAAAIPWSAFVDGHPYRIRYMIPLLAAEGVLAGVGAGLSKRIRPVALAALAIIVVLELRPLDSSTPMVVEAQWDRPNLSARDRVTACLAPNYHGETVMVSLGSLSHYVQDLSRNGFQIRDFLHEGNGDIWLNALYNPRPFVGWILVEELAEGGDMLAKHARENPSFLNGFSRTCEAAGLVLYRRNPMKTSEDVRR